MSAVMLSPLPTSPAPTPTPAPGGGEKAPASYSFASVLGGMHGRQSGGAKTETPVSVPGAPDSSTEASSPSSLSSLLNSASTKTILGAGGLDLGTRKASLAADSADPSSIEAALAALGYGAQAAITKGSAPSAGAATLPAGSPPSSPSALPAPLAATPDAAAWDLTGAVPLKSLLSADPSLGLQSLQPKTHLAVADATPVRASGAGPRARAAPNAAAASDSAASSLDVLATGGGGASGHPGFADSSASREVKEVKPDDAVLVGGDVATPVLADASVDPGTNAIGPISLTQLPDVVADQANVLSSATAASPAATAAMAPQAVKELEIALDPADLGAVSLKLRLANGKLSVIIGVSSGTTLSAIENEREAIAEKLGSSGHPLEDLIIRAQSAPSSNFEGQDASDLDDRSSSNAGSREKSAGDGGASARGREGSLGGSATPRGALGDLLV